MIMALFMITTEKNQVRAINDVSVNLMYDLACNRKSGVHLKTYETGTELWLKHESTPKPHLSLKKIVRHGDGYSTSFSTTVEKIKLQTIDGEKLVYQK